MEKAIKIFIFVTIPLFLWGLTGVLPTFDDWTYCTAPHFCSFFDNEYLLPYNSYWRPFDGIFGYLLGLNYKLFPLLNHIFIFLGHLMCTGVVYFLLTKRNILSAVFFYASTAILGAVLDIDSLNQVYSQFWGLVALWCYLNGRKALWVACFLIATLCKENGIMFAFVPILIKWGYDSGWKIERRYFKDAAVATIAVIAYGVVRIALTLADSSFNKDYLDTSTMDHVVDAVQYISYTIFPIDYAALLYPPERNVPLAVVTALLALPFICILLTRLWDNRRKKQLYVLILAFFVVAAPHLLTIFSVMHAYAGLGIAAMLLGYLFPEGKMDRKEVTMLLLYLTASVISIGHHIDAATESGKVGKQMALSALSKIEGKPQRVYLVEIDNNEQKYSMFYTTPQEAFGWGLALRHESGYTIGMEEIRDTIIGPFASNTEKAKALKSVIDKKKASGQYDAILTVEFDKVKVIKK